MRAKLHSYKSIEEKRRRRVKGIKKAVIKKNITHGDYGECLFSGNMQMRKINVIRSHKPYVFTETIKKIISNADDD